MCRRVNIKAVILLVGFMSLLTCFDSYAYIRHEVQRSESLYGIAYKYKVSAADIVKANPQAANGIKHGMILNIPESGDDVSPIDTPTGRATIENAPSTKDTEHTPATIITNQDITTDNLPNTAETAPQIDAKTVDPIFMPVDKKSIDDGIYISRFGDTLEAIAGKTGVSFTTLLNLNPIVNPYHIDEGTPIRLRDDAPYINYNGITVSVVDSIIYRIKPTDTVQAATELPARTVALLLPFDVDNTTISRQSLLATDFYKGFLMALKRNTGGGMLPIKIIAIDTHGDMDKLNANLEALVSEHVSVIIPPEDEAQLDAVQQFALQNNILVLNALNIKDEGYTHYPNVLQCNINQKLMYEKAIDVLLKDYADYTPVIIDIANTRDDKSTFIDELRQRYADASRKVLDISAEGKLTKADIDRLPASSKYIFIPKSGSVDVFNKISEPIAEAMENDPTAENYKLFGYPDWIVFRGEQEEMLHRLGAVIYSRFFMDESDPRTRDVNDEYIRWYGTQMEDVYPAQGMLGYDVGNMLFSALLDKSADNDFNKIENTHYRGIQSAFHFVRDNRDNLTSGSINDALYVIEYLPAAGVYVTIR